MKNVVEFATGKSSSASAERNEVKENNYLIQLTKNQIKIRKERKKRKGKKGKIKRPLHSAQQIT